MVENINIALQQEVSEDLLEVREGGRGMQLVYMSNYGTKTMLNTVFGNTGWSYSVDRLDIISDGPEVAYRAQVRLIVTVDNKMVTRSDVGFGNGKFGSNYDKHELAGKEAVTDALKRCACSLGPALGLHLYDKNNSIHGKLTGKSKSKPKNTKPTAAKPPSGVLSKYRQKAKTPKARAPKSDRQEELEKELLSEDTE